MTLPFLFKYEAQSGQMRVINDEWNYSQKIQTCISFQF